MPRSQPALHDQGISCFYLGVVKLGTGKVEEAKRLINRSMILHPEPWLLAKANAGLKDLEGKGAHGWSRSMTGVQPSSFGMADSSAERPS